MAMKKFKPKDVVRLPSSDQLMTVVEEAANEGYIACEWITPSGEHRRDAFTEDSLILVTEAPKK